MPSDIPHDHFAVHLSAPHGEESKLLREEGSWVKAESVDEARCLVAANVVSLSKHERKAWEARFGRLMNHDGQIVARFRSDLKIAWRSPRM
jgi:hypothetical protein